MSDYLTIVITTIQEPTPSVKIIIERMMSFDGALIVIGDKKGPARFELPKTEMFTLEDQRKLPFSLAHMLPTGHYARKNLGYLIAFSRQALCIYETDDDNAPSASWQIRSMATTAQRVAPRRWVNAFRLFTDELIWPRGFPLELVSDAATYAHNPSAPVVTVDAPVQQGLANLCPDVDAIWRLVMDREFQFRDSPSVWLPPGSWCPFNSQSTWWRSPAYPLMYLPSHCTFRMTDIWRSFIAQRCLWELGYGLVFHPAEVVQQRNAHNLLTDFKDEVPGYLSNQSITETLASLALKPGSGAVSDNLLSCYEALVMKQFFPKEELSLVEAWISDVESLLSSRVT